MNRLLSNFILGFFVVMLVIVYGVFKQPSISSLQVPNDSVVEKTAEFSGTQLTLPNGQIINVMVATSLEDRQQGLSGVESLASNAGMLLVFPDSGQHSIWMKEMNFPLDIIWLNEAGKVVYLIEEAPVQDNDSGGLPIYQSELPAKYVLEIKAGTVSSSGIEIGDTIVLS